MNPDATTHSLDHLPHGLRGLLAYPFAWKDWWWLILACLVIASLWGVLWWRQRRKKEVKAKPEEDPLVTLERVLRNMVPPREFRGKPAIDYVFELNMTFRQYIEARAPIRATDLTLRELRKPLREKCPLSRDTIDDVLRFLERSEAIKYAGAKTDLEEAVDFHAQVLKWVSFMRPKHLSESKETAP